MEVYLLKVYYVNLKYESYFINPNYSINFNLKFTKIQQNSFPFIWIYYKSYNP